MASCPECAGSAMSIKFNKLPIYHLRNPFTARFAFSFLLLLPFSKDNHFYRVLSSPLHSSTALRLRALLPVSFFSKKESPPYLESWNCYFRNFLRRMRVSSRRKGRGIVCSDVKRRFRQLRGGCCSRYFVFNFRSPPPPSSNFYFIYICVHTAKWFTTCACAGGN